MRRGVRKVQVVSDLACVIILVRLTRLGVSTVSEAEIQPPIAVLIAFERYYTTERVGQFEFQNPPRFGSYRLQLLLQLSSVISKKCVGRRTKATSLLVQYKILIRT
jgi:hypothetical protein